MTRKTVLFLYTEFSSYLDCCVNLLIENNLIDFHLVRYPVNKEAPFNFNNLKFASYCRSEFQSKKKLLDFALKLKPDLLLVSGWIDRDYLFVALKLKSCIKVMAMDTQWNGSIKQNLMTKFALNYFIKRFGAVWVPGNKQKELAHRIGFADSNILDGFYSCNVQLFKNYYLQSIELKRKSYPKVFLFMGRYINSKCIHELCTVFKNISNKHNHDWELWCVGTGEEWENRIIHPKIKHLGFLQPDQLNDVIAKSGVYILPSKFEPWGVSLHEFVSAGFPIIASNQVGSTEIFLENNRNGYIFDSYSKDGLKEAIIKMMKMSSSEMLSMSEESLILSNKITPNLWVDKLMSLL